MLLEFFYGFDLGSFVLFLVAMTYELIDEGILEFERLTLLRFRKPCAMCQLKITSWSCLEVLGSKQIQDQDHNVFYNHNNFSCHYIYLFPLPYSLLHHLLFCCSSPLLFVPWGWVDKIYPSTFTPTEIHLQVTCTHWVSLSPFHVFDNNVTLLQPPKHGCRDAVPVLEWRSSLSESLPFWRLIIIFIFWSFWSSAMAAAVRPDTHTQTHTLPITVSQPSLLHTHRCHPAFTHDPLLSHAGCLWQVFFSLWVFCSSVSGCECCLWCLRVHGHSPIHGHRNTHAHYGHTHSHAHTHNNTPPLLHHTLFCEA